MSNLPIKPPEEKQSLTNQAISGLLWMISGTGVQSVIKLLVMIILARLLKPEDFGLISAAMIVISFSEIFSMLGIAPAIVQRPELELRHIQTGFTTSILFGILLAIFLWLSAPSIAKIFRMSNLTPILQSLVFVFPLESISVTSKAILRRELQFSSLVKIDLVSYIFGYGLIGISLAWLGYGVYALTWAILIQAFLSSVISLNIQPHSLRPRIERQAFKDLIYFGGGTTTARILNYVALKGDNFIVGRWLGASALGLYGRAYGLMTVTSTLSSHLLDKILFPILAKVQNDLKQLSRAFRLGTTFIALTVLPTSAIFIILAPDLINLLLGPVWMEVVPVFQILTLGMLFRTGYKLSNSLARATGAVYKMAWRQGIYAVLIIAGTWVGKTWGLSGVAFGVVGALAIHFLLMVHLSLQLTSMSWRDFLVLHFPASILTLVLGTEVWIFATVLREMHLPSSIILVGTLLPTGITVLLLLRLKPTLILGQEGKWIVDTFYKYFKQKIYPLIGLQNKVEYAN